jgi:hypothetical protein
MNCFTKHHLQPWGIGLVNKYLLIFTEKDESNMAWLKQSGIAEADYVNLRYGFECHEGWSGIIENIAKSGTELVTYLREHGHPDAYIHSCIVKEKFGTLRWQGTTGHLPELFRDMWQSHVSHLESLSSAVCEETGKFGITRTSKNGSRGCWIRTLCTEKALEMGYDLMDWEKEKPEPFDGAKLDKVMDR